ncbi:MAG: hypothetical protein R2867_30675 [Caldilineaceae bacterium]
METGQTSVSQSTKKAGSWSPTDTKSIGIECHLVCALDQLSVESIAECRIWCFQQCGPCAHKWQEQGIFEQVMAEMVRFYDKKRKSAEMAKRLMARTALHHWVVLIQDATPQIAASEVASSTSWSTNGCAADSFGFGCQSP